VSLLLRALQGENTPTAPIWIMRQAGRYLPEYLAIKAKASFLEMVQTPELAAEITMQPLKRFPLDAAIIFSDIMTPLPAMGIQVDFAPGPKITPLRTAKEIHDLRIPDPLQIALFMEQALRMVRAALEPSIPLIGFAGAPITLAAYLVQGSGSKDFEDFRAWLRLEPTLAHVLLEKLTVMTIAYLKNQITAGANIIQLFDSWAGLHSQAMYQEFALPYNQRVLAALEDLVPRIYLAVGASHLYPLIAQLPCEAISVDWRLPLGQIRNMIPNKTLQGNLDPAALLGTVSSLEHETNLVLQNGLGAAHIFNLGHGIFRQTKPDMVLRLIDQVHSFNRLGHP
jgi:uroporphyrinogen decarboxylase